MANLPSSKKRMKQNERRHARNRAHKSALKTETRKLLDTIHDGNVQVARDQLQLVSRKLDQLASKGTLHRNNASRKKSRLARRLNAALTEKSK